MFDGLPDQFHPFIVSRPSLPLPLSFPLHASSSPITTFPAPYDPYNPSHHHLPALQPTLLHPLHHKDHHHEHKQQQQQQQNNFPSSMNLEIIQRDHQRSSISEDPPDPWTNDEVLALLRIRSTVENWLPDFTWEHVSRYSTT